MDTSNSIAKYSPTEAIDTLLSMSDSELVTHLNFVKATLEKVKDYEKVMSDLEKMKRKYKCERDQNKSRGVVSEEFYKHTTPDEVDRLVSLLMNSLDVGGYGCDCVVGNHNIVTCVEIEFDWDAKEVEKYKKVLTEGIRFFYPHIEVKFD